ncbi:hypothetical protein SAMN04489761_1671 [Tenacibaculum sp. MAR_2009_124]|uniref:hypothetical protein n=1 Tax=Tenacibaculum sp. MAR_2009_124 TaxID=1250059 RepID=UPI000896ED9E|nr:hypothetical protein [Tenacibaculum sp. MAR_2009_124]SEB75577.1 hypothetical protein SAMN04489761_1671 [Tenacibaculum sp. MAR_2009_124]
MNTQSPLTIVNKHLNYPKVTLVKATTSQYLHIAAEIDKTSFPFFLGKSSCKKSVLKFCKHQAEKIKKEAGVINYSVFSAIIIPPGRGKYVQENISKTHLAKFDVVILIEINSLENAKKLLKSKTYDKLVSTIKMKSSYSHITQASNVRQIGPVDHTKQGIFLFNYFYAKSTIQNLLVWEYTAGWFEKETKLNNSTLLLPNDDSKYTIINHCRWDNLWNIVPHLIFKKTFKSYVLDNFYANKVGAQPILYKLV